MKCSHTFNLLDARGAISVTERAAYIGRVRKLARAVAQSYYESRERLGFPMRRAASRQTAHERRRPCERPLLVELLHRGAAAEGACSAWADAFAAALRRLAAQATGLLDAAARELPCFATPRRLARAASRGAPARAGRSRSR